jgi:curved DNA-binding protein CbpA
MNSSWIRTKLETVVALAHVLECVEAGTASASADGYRRLVLRLQADLSEDIPTEALQAILRAYPATGQLYENLHYGNSGLSRAPLERSASSELVTKQILARAARRVVPKTTWRSPMPGFGDGSAATRRPHSGC